MTGAIAFAVPGDIRTRTGGYLYDLHLTEALADLGMHVRQMIWGKSFPEPDPRDAEAALAQLRALPATCPALVDGLGFCALDPEQLGAVTAPLFALVHHPLALEPGLPHEKAVTFARRERRNLMIARHVFVTSRHTAGLLARQYEVPNAKVTVVEPGFARPLQAEVDDTAKAAPMILSVGLLARRKGHDILLRALTRVADLDWQADIVGRDHEPGMMEQLKAQASELGLGARVSFSGEIDAEALDLKYRRATLFALATRYEGYGIVFGEAMGYGLPIASTTAGAVPQTVGSEAGLLAAPDDPEAFAMVLRRMLEDDALRKRCASAGLRAAQALPTWPDAARLVRNRIQSCTATLSGA